MSFNDPAAHVILTRSTMAQYNQNNVLTDMIHCILCFRLTEICNNVSEWCNHFRLVDSHITIMGV